MFTQVFVILQVILKAVGLWDLFEAWYEKKKIADAEKDKQDRDNAIDEQKKAKDEDQFDKDQGVIVDHIP